MKKELMPQRLTTAIVLIFLTAAFSAALLGCGSIKSPPSPTPEQQAEQIEPMLSAAGFRMLPADTPERQQQLSSLVPMQVDYYLGKTGTLHSTWPIRRSVNACTSAPRKIISSTKN